MFLKKDTNTRVVLPALLQTLDLCGVKSGLGAGVAKTTPQLQHHPKGPKIRVG